MSILEMKKLTLIAPLQEKEKLLSQFSRSGKYHLINMAELPDTVKGLEITQKDDLTAKMTAVYDCMEYVKKCLDKKQLQLKNEKSKEKVAVSLEGKKSQVTFDELITFDDKEDFLMQNCIARATEYAETMRDAEQEQAKLYQEKRALEIYRNMDVPFSAICDTKNTAMLLGIAYNLKQEGFEQLCQQYPQAQFAQIGVSGSNTALLVVCHVLKREEISAQLLKYNFSSCTFNYSITAAERIREIETQENNYNLRHQLALDESCDLGNFLPDLKILYDCYYYRRQIAETDDKICNTKRTFILQCWFPANAQEDTEKLLCDTLTVYYSDYQLPADNETPPTVVVQSKIIQPFTAITDMYSLPNYREIDPNPVVAVFYWLFMGLIMGDVGYGVLMALVAVVFVKFLKAEGGLKNLALIIGYSGLSTVIWGVLFGGWFAIENFPIKTILFSPLYQPLEMILLCLVMGTVHMMSGIVLSALNKIKKNDIWGAILDDLPWFTFDIGIIMVLIPVFGGLLSWQQDFSILMTVGLITMCASMGILVIFGGRKNKGIGKIFGGLGNVYNVINVVSDILSYLRLFGLGLTTGVIGMVFNILGGMLLGSPISAVFGVIVLMFGHALNLAISLLGAYIHDARLQHIEFFGKFYTGEGKPFISVASNRKFTKIK